MPKKDQGLGPGAETPFPGDDTVVCGVIRHLGGDYLLAKCMDGVDRKVRIPGKLRKRVWINEGDIILVGLWDFSPDKGEVVYKYGRNEINKLIEKGFLSKEFIDALSEYV